MNINEIKKRLNDKSWCRYQWQYEMCDSILKELESNDIRTKFIKDILESSSRGKECHMRIGDKLFIIKEIR